MIIIFITNLFDFRIYALSFTRQQIYISILSFPLLLSNVLLKGVMCDYNRKDKK